VPLVENTGPKAEIVSTPPASDNKKGRGSALRQVIAAFVANIGTVNTGMVFGFSAVVLPQLQAPNSTIPVDEDQASWIGKCLLKFIQMDFSSGMSYLQNQIQRKKLG